MPSAKAKSKQKCHINDKVENGYIDEIREKVCANDLPLTKYTDGNHYCLFHLPTADKDKAKFDEIFQARLVETREKLIAIEHLDEEEIETVRSRIDYDFRYVWFPSEINFFNYKFEAGVNFLSATFTQKVSFSYATFNQGAYFGDATFNQDAFFGMTTFSQDASFFSATFNQNAHFDSTTFIQRAYFGRAIFNQDISFGSVTFTQNVDFSYATFIQNAHFSSATFIQNAHFNSATFIQNAYFGTVKFLETAQVFFTKTKFCNLVDFQFAVFAGYASFEGTRGNNVFLGKEVVSDIENKLEENFKEIEINFGIKFELDENQEAVLDLQNTRLSKSELISFHTVRLCPSWFVNIDSRKMIFTDVRWDNIEAQFFNANLKVELKSLAERKISEPNHLLEIASRQLAVNAEENNRYDEASDFRYMAMEARRLKLSLRGYAPWRLHFWYWLSSGYGERWIRAFVMLIMIWFAFAWIYSLPISSFADKKPQAQENPQEQRIENETRRLEFNEAMAYSFGTMLLQKPEPAPANPQTKSIVWFETVLGALQAALLALAVRRKFMR